VSTTTEYLVEQIRLQQKVIEAMAANRAGRVESGFDSAVAEIETQKRDPSHPFTRSNPFRMHTAP